jgi:hypothetical protein
MFMSAAAANLSQTSQPGPSLTATNKAGARPAETDKSGSQPAATDKPSRGLRLLVLVQMLIDYGKQLAASLSQQNAPSPIGRLARDFGTIDIARILARIRCGLQRAQALEERILRIGPRLDAGPKPRPTTPRASRPARASTPSERRERPDADKLPTAEEIAARVRRQPIGVVLADICRDLGILPGHPLWGEVQAAVIEFGGSFVRLFTEMIHRPMQLLQAQLKIAWQQKNGPPAASGATGPP